MSQFKTCTAATHIDPQYRTVSRMRCATTPSSWSLYKFRAASLSFRIVINAAGAAVASFCDSGAICEIMTYLLPYFQLQTPVGGLINSPRVWRVFCSDLGRTPPAAMYDRHPLTNARPEWCYRASRRVTYVVPLITLSHRALHGTRGKLP